MSTPELDMSFGSPDRLTAWKGRPLPFKLRHRYNVASSFLTGSISARSCLFGLRFPESVVALAAKPPLRGMVYVCPEVIADLDQQLPMSNQ